MVGGSLWLLRLLPPIKIGRHDILVAEILLKVVLKTKNQLINQSFMGLIFIKVKG